jgi:hypothetical protein
MKVEAPEMKVAALETKVEAPAMKVAIPETKVETPATKVDQAKNVPRAKNVSL